MKTKSFPEMTPQRNWETFPQFSNNRFDQLYQGPFPLEIIPNSQLVMTTLPSDKPLPNYGMGLTAYVIGDLPPQLKSGESLQEAIEKIVKLPMVNTLYIRPSWREMQRKRGRLDLCPAWQITFDLAAKYQKRVAFRVMLNNPSVPEETLPDFVLEKVPMHNFGRYSGPTGYIKENDLRFHIDQRVPHYQHSYFLNALDEFDGLLADAYNGSEHIEYVDTYMYGFWGEGHTWPFLDDSPFPDHVIASETWMTILEMQDSHWNKTPLVTNTQPDDNHVGNLAILEQSIKCGNWIRTDSIFAENQQIEVISNRPPYIACICEGGLSDGTKETLRIYDGIPYTENLISHAKDLGANYFSIWNWHNIHADHILNYYNQYPDGIDQLNRRIGYRVRPSLIWEYQQENRMGLILGMVNDGIANVPGILQLTLLDQDGLTLATGTLEAGYPLVNKVRQVRMILPEGKDWEGARLMAAIIVKGVSHSIQWACRESVNHDGSLTLKRTPNLY